jgi:hypothetical protein
MWLLRSWDFQRKIRKRSLLMLLDGCFATGLECRCNFEIFDPITSSPSSSFVLSMFRLLGPAPILTADPTTFYSCETFEIIIFQSGLVSIPSPNPRPGRQWTMILGCTSLVWLAPLEPLSLLCSLWGVTSSDKQSDWRSPPLSCFDSWNKISTPDGQEECYVVLYSSASRSTQTLRGSGFCMC